MVLGPLTEHFVNWLVSNGYEQDSFDRPDIGPSGSFGGKLNAAQQAIFFENFYIKFIKIQREPVVFIHGTVKYL